MANVKLSDAINRIAVKCKSLFDKVLNFTVQTSNGKKDLTELTEPLASKSYADSKQEKIGGVIEAGKKYLVELDANNKLQVTEYTASGGGGEDGLGQQERILPNSKKLINDRAALIIQERVPSSNMNTSNSLFTMSKPYIEGGFNFGQSIAPIGFKLNDTLKKIENITWINGITNMDGKVSTEIRSITTNIDYTINENVGSFNPIVITKKGDLI